ncbi:MAG: spore coat protein H [Granulosicoccus sp.]
MLNKLFLISVLLFTTSLLGLAQVVLFSVPEGQFRIDYNQNIIVANHSEFPSTSGATEVLVDFEQVYQFNTVPTQLEMGVGYQVQASGENYTLYFSPLPLMVIESVTEVMDEPMTLAQIDLLTIDQATVNSFAGIEIRGGFSQTYDKTSYRI